MKLVELGGKIFFFDGKTFLKNPPPYKLLAFYYSIGQIEKLFLDKFADTPTKGLDRLNGFQFGKQLGEHARIISKKCLSGKYVFTPYAEVLQQKGRGKEPRVIGVPCIRDRLVLYQLKEILSNVFPECVPKSRANTLIHRISRDIIKIHTEGFAKSSSVLKCDIKSFYDKIDRNKLMSVLRTKIKSEKVLRLIEAAITTPIVPRHYKRENLSEYRTKEGVPQGLSISNILASIYLSGFDKTMRSTGGISYYRYVDDVLIFGESNLIDTMPACVQSNLKALGLDMHDLNSGKSSLVKLTEQFDYLGYRFDSDVVTVRESTVEHFLKSIVGKFSEYSHNRAHRLQKHKHLTPDRLKQVFLMELNERITGAISEKRRYGWISYFSEINDKELLGRLDRIISGFFCRLNDFSNKAPRGLKTLARAYYEVRYSPSAGYIHNYDSYDTLPKKIRFLEERNRLNPDRTYTDEEIEQIFDAYRSQILSKLEEDDGIMY